MIKATKDHAIGVSLSALVSMIAVGSFVWMVTKPAITEAVADELKDEVREQIRQTVNQEVAPVKSAQMILLEQQVLQSQRQIAQLERLRAADPAAWTSEQTNELVDVRSQLEAQQRALAVLRR